MTMKKVKLAILFLFALANFTKAVADDYIPLVKEGAAWRYDMRYQTGDTQSNITFCFEGDTIIENEKYKCLYVKMIFTYPEYHVTSRFDSAWQEQGKKVYVWNGYLNKKVLYYDFSLRKDDAIPCICNEPEDAIGKVTDEDTIEVNGIKRRRLEVSYEYEERGKQQTVRAYWVEGIGSSHALSTPVAFAPGGYDYFEYFENGNCFFTQENFYLPRNGAGTASGISSCYSENMGKTHSEDCFDLQGRRLKGEPKRGVYIKDGKKYCR